MSYQLALLCLVTSLIYICVRFYINTELQYLQYLFHKGRSGHDSLISDMFKNFRSLRSNMINESYYRKYFNNIYKMSYSRNSEAVIRSIDSSVYNFLVGMESVLILVFSFLLISKNSLTLGLLFSFVSFKYYFNRKLKFLADSFFERKVISHHIDNVVDFFDMNNHGDSKSRKRLTVLNEIELSEVSHNYSGVMTFDNVSYKFLRGRKYLINGDSGSGKSTLIDIITTIEDDYNGMITANGICYKNLDLPSLRKRITVINQNQPLQVGSIKDNITSFSEEADLDKLYASCKVVGLSDFIDSIPMKYNTPVNEYLGFSGGQIQRINLARALYSDSDFLIMDEPTSSLPERDSRLIIDYLLNIDKRTVILSSHCTSIKNKFSNELVL